MLPGEALIQCRVSPGTVKIKAFEIPFYDDYFQRQTDTVAVSKGNELFAAERCLHEALRRCRKGNIVKRGLTEKERKRNGYWVAYQIAEAVLKKL